MEDFNLVLRGLINNDSELENIEIPENLKNEFNKTAENYLQKDLVLEAIKTFAITKNSPKLNEVGEFCIANTRLELALKSFYYSKNKEGLSKTGMGFIAQGDVNNALIAFKLAENKEMIEFITKNF